jgi:hypothetical protein
MSMHRARVAIFAGAAVPLPLLLGHCGSTAGQESAVRSGSDSSLPEAAAADGGVTQETEDDAQGDAMDESAPRIRCVPPVGADAGDAGHAATDGAAGSCLGTMTCCGGWCTDVTKDPRNCGSCGNPCMPAQFCTGASCDDAILKNLCGNAHATVVLDPYVPDNEAGTMFGAGLAAECVPPVMMRTTPQDSGVALSPTGRPMTGPGDTLIAGGGFFGQVGVDYMEKNKVAPLALGTDGTNSWILDNKTGASIVMIPTTMLSASLDYFALEVSVEPKSGTLCFFGFGMLVPGTGAAGYYFQNNVAPHLAMFPDAWYVYGWTDTDNNGVPSAGDTFTRISQGN